MGFLAACAFAQSTIIPDDTLGAETSRISSEGVSRELIEGGAQRDANLFHSFREFNVAENQAAYFANPAGIENILVRVTGGNRSDILGTLGVLGGNADLFLLNPNGIFFGPNAQLEVGGAFIATSAEALQFGTQGLFSAANPEAPPLLTVNPSAFLFNQINPGAINSQANLRVVPGQSLLLLGGDIQLDGEQLVAPTLEDFERSSVAALGGRIELGSVSSPGAVTLSQQGSRWMLGYEGVETFGQINLKNEAIVNAGVRGGGDIHVQAANLVLQDGSRINNRPQLGQESGGDITVITSDSVDLSGIGTPSFVRTSPGGLFAGSEFEGGDSGNITISTRTLTVRDGAAVSAAAFNGRNGGDLRVIARDSVDLIGAIAGPNPLTGGMQLFTSNLAAGAIGIARGGRAGNLQIDTEHLTIRDGAAIITATLNSIQGGNVIINASESVSVSGASDSIVLGGNILPEVPSGIFIDTAANQNLDSSNPQIPGNLTINTQYLLVEDGAVISASALDSGQAGNLTINASESVQLNGASNVGIPSGLYSQNLATGDSGKLAIQTRKLNISNGARISVASSRGIGISFGVLGTILDAFFPDIELELSIPETPELGNAGALEVEARSIILNNRGAISATADSGNGGDIMLRGLEQPSLDLLIMRDNSQISTNAGTIGAGGSGGNITINGDFLISVPNENSDITANAFEGPGGTITITARGIFGFEPRSVDELRASLDPDDPLNPNRLASNDITAISQTNPSLSGQVVFNGLDVDPSQSLEAIPVETVSTEIAQGCYAETEVVQSEFVVVGRGGLPPGPSDIHGSDNTQVDLVTITPEAGQEGRAEGQPRDRDEVTASRSVSLSSRSAIVEAQGWMRNEQGQVVLIAEEHSSSTSQPWPVPGRCNGA